MRIDFHTYIGHWPFRELRGNTAAGLAAYMARFGIDHAVVSNVSGIFYKNTQPANAELAAVERALTLPADCMAMEIERLRLTPDTPGTYRLALALRPDDGEAIAQEYNIIVE